MTNQNLIVAAVCMAALAGAVARAQVVVPVDTEEDVNVVTLGIGLAPDYMGSSDYKPGIGPAVRYNLPDTYRYFLLLGPQATLNIMDDENWRFGPMLNYRFGRDSDVEDAVVKRMQKIDGTPEAGGFVIYRLPLSEARMHQINFGADLAMSENGVIGSLRTTYWQPLSPSTFLNVGAGAIFVDNEWMQTYFGVTDPRDIALYPSLGRKPFDASGGLKSITIPFGLTQALSEEWLVSVGGRYEQLLNDAKHSPVTEDRGSSSQWIFGVGASYLF